MEQAPGRSRQQIESDLANLQREIIGLEDSLGRQHQDTGSDSIDDESQEAAAEGQSLDLMRAQLAEMRQRMTELQDQLAKAA